MPQFQSELTFEHPLSMVFDFHTTTRRLLELLPPDASAVLVSGPAKLSPMDEFELKVSVWGLSQQLRFQVLEVESPSRIVTMQTKGPFRSWRETHEFFAQPHGGTTLSYQVDFTPPGGMMGLMVTADKVMANLHKAMEYRQRRTSELLSQSSPMPGRS